MTQKGVWRKATIWVGIALLLAGCQLLADTAETPEVTPQPAENQLVFAVPYRAVLDAGESVPGAQLEYVGETDDGIHVRIDGEDAFKKVGDSFNWKGGPAAGVETDYQLRVMGVYIGVFQAWGDMRLTINNPIPVVTDLPDEAPLVFNAAIATYTVAKDKPIPGTTYSYLGQTDKGAQFGGVEGYAYREVFDSLDWSGAVLSNTFVDITMRVTSIKDEEVTLAGTATIWVFP